MEAAQVRLRLGQQDTEQEAEERRKTISVEVQRETHGDLKRAKAEAKPSRSRKPSPDAAAEELVNRIVFEIQDLWELLLQTKLLEVERDPFARTIPAQYKELVREVTQRCLQNDAIFKKTEFGLFCAGCKAYLGADEMDEGYVCKTHQTMCDLRSEENYFFRLSKYREALHEHIRKNPNFILPPSSREQVLLWLEEDRGDPYRAVLTMQNGSSWGIPFRRNDSQDGPI